MAENYRALTETIKNRLNPDNILLEKSFSAELGSISYNDVLVFVRYAMRGVEPEYTQKSIDAGNRVKEHLNAGGLTNVDYRFQGSVMTNTHIKGYSDIDLLCISDKFNTWASGEVNRYLNEANLREKIGASNVLKLERKKMSASAYQGDSLLDLKVIRLSTENILTRVYTVYDTSKPKSVKITNTSLKRDVDVVTANWYDDVRAIMYEGEVNRGIEVYNKDFNRTESPDFPFVSIDRINSRSATTNGRLKKMIRFLKNIRSLSKVQIDLSSYDINAICYDIEVQKYQNTPFTGLVGVLYNQLYSLTTSQQHADSISSVDDREYIFRGKPSKITSIKLALNELSQIYIDLPKNIIA